MINESSYAYDVATELGLTTPYASEVAGEVGLTSSAYGEDVATAINDNPTSIRVLQYNVGHFNMGMQSGAYCYIGADNATTQAYPQFFDYATQLGRWTSRISGIDADLIGAEEWNPNFGYNGGSLVPIENTGIFDGHNISAGAWASNYWWMNTVMGKRILSNVQDIDLGSIVAAKAYVRVATITIGGKSVKFASTHLNWNQGTGYYESRQIELRNLVKLFQNDDYVILCGDFNTQGPPGGTRWEGLEEFDIFINGFTENGETYPGGFTLANSTSNPLLTSPATNSRPDSGGSQVPVSYLDNIITKGFTMSNVTVIDDGMITDHCGLWCDLTMINNNDE